MNGPHIMNKLAAIAIGATLVAGVPALAHAQDQGTDTQRVAEAADREDRGEWGWIGLLGLAGLLGLKRRDRDDTVRSGAASTTR
jgi:hypothetical protein